MNKVNAIQTIYKNYHFRSRLEAKWAVYFDAAKVRWEYEIEGFDLSRWSETFGDVQLGRYLPDFWLPDQRAWVEIKGEVPAEHWRYTLPEMQMWALVQETEAKAGFVFFGMPDFDTPCSVVEDDEYPNRWSDGIHGICSRGNYEIEDYIAAAKSARFEFGQKGATR